MRSWDVAGMPVEPAAPRILASTPDARVIALHLPAGEGLWDHQVHETAWLVVIAGEVEVESEDGTVTRGAGGFVVSFEPHERHEVRALVESRLLLLLTPWPGPGHPGTLSLDDKRHVRERARERAEPGAA